MDLFYRFAMSELIDGVWCDADPLLIDWWCIVEPGEFRHATMLEF